MGPSFAVDDQKKLRFDASRQLLSLLRMYAEHNFERIATDDESWFQYSSCSDSTFAGSRESVVSRNRRDISGQKTMLAIFFTSRRLLLLKALQKGTKFNHNYFIDAIFPGLYNEKRRISCEEGFPAFSVHLDNSMCHKGNKISEKLAKRSIKRAPHPLYSPDISPCDFWFIGLLKHKMKDREFQSQQVILSAVAKMWNDLTFADVQRVFQEWMERLTWVVGNNGEHYPNQRNQCRKWSTVQ
jgi:transposase